MTTTTTKAAAWRRAADVLRRYVDKRIYGDGRRRRFRLPTDVDEHIFAVVIPSLVRRAEIIERRRKAGR